MSIPGGDSVNRPGWDGTLLCDHATFPVPDGCSAWEFGTSVDVVRKANNDYQTRTNNPINAVPSDTTLVIVTARRWPFGAPTKDDWINTKKANGPWKDVRIIDADDLESWLEQTPSVAAWLGHVHGKPLVGAEGLDAFWERCTTDTEPTLTPEIILAGRESLGQKFNTWSLEDNPILRVKADTAEEALLLVAAWAKAEGGATEEYLFANTIVVHSADTWRQIADHLRPLVLAPLFQRSALGLSNLTKRGHWVIIPSDWSASDNDVLVAPWLDREKLKKALENAGLSDKSARRSADNCGRSLQVLTRQLSKAGERQTPPWAELTTAQTLIPALLAGQWNSGHGGDQEALSILAGKPYDQWEHEIQPLFSIQDAPIRRFGDVVVLTSPIDAWRLLGQKISPATWSRYRDLLLALLQERDPKLDLPPEKRWFSTVYNKEFRHSEKLREGFIEQLARIAGSEDRIKLDINPTAGIIAAYLLREALSPATAIERWMSVGRLLPDLAEVAPDAFLDRLEELIRTPDNARLLFEKSDFMSSTSPHIYVMWAVQRTRWFKNALRRSGDCLIALHALDPGDNSSPRPKTVFGETFCPQMPDNTAKYSDQLELLSAYLHDHGKSVWHLVHSIMPTGRSFRLVDHGPRFRLIDDDSDQPETWGELWQRCDNLLTLLIKHAGDELEYWCKLIEMVDDVHEKSARYILETLRAKCSSMSKNSEFCLTIFHSLMLLHRRHEAFPDATWVMPTERLKIIEELASEIAPDDAVEMRKWIFVEQFPGKYLPDGDHDLRRDRIDAVGEIFRKHGIDGIERLAKATASPGYIGEAIALGDIEGSDKFIIFNYFVNQQDGVGEAIARCFIGSLYTTLKGDVWKYAANLDGRSFGRFAQGLPATPDVWDFLEKRGKDAEETYWQGIGWFHHSDNAESINRAARCLFRFGRPYQAAITVSHAKVSLEYDLILEAIEALTSIITSRKDGISVNNLRYDVVGLFESMATCADINTTDLVKLEFKYYSLLDGAGYEFPFIRHAFEDDPTFFVYVITMRYPREDDGKDDAADWTAQPNAEAIAQQLFDILHDFDAMPGLKDSGNEAEQKLATWIEEALACAEGVSRRILATQKIGDALARAPIAHGEAWPPEHVCNVMERFWSDDLGKGFSCGARNKLGARFVGDGEPDAALSEQYRLWADSRQITHPHVSSILRCLSVDFANDAERHKRDGELRRQTE